MNKNLDKLFDAIMSQKLWSFVIATWLFYLGKISVDLWETVMYLFIGTRLYEGIKDTIIEIVQTKILNKKGEENVKQ